MLYAKYTKRLFDIAFALFMLPLLCIITLIVSVLIYFDDKNSIFYNAKRIGQYGHTFTMYKFRTMIKNAPDIRLEDGSTFNSINDSRLTRVGKFLRKTSIDELPQIINILNGNMSFIGPRPDPIDWLQKYTKEQKQFLHVKPGISGYNQAYFRNSANSIEKINNDIFYSQNISLSLDLKIVIKTIKSVLFHENLYIDESRKTQL